jgi:S-adenosyl-L-methionine hydrolase (adenosine-forming)
MTHLRVTPRPRGGPDTAALLKDAWSETVVAHGTLYRPAELPALVARTAGGTLVGALTYHLDGDALEIVTIDARPRHHGAAGMDGLRAGAPPPRQRPAVPATTASRSGTSWCWRSTSPRPANVAGMAGYRWISLTTDYGTSDGFVAACHGVIAQIAPELRVLDVTHHVPPGDVARGAAMLAQTVLHLPPAVHVAVIDPGVGTERRAVVITTPGGLLVGPDNGLLPWAADALGGATAAVVLTNKQWFRHPVSRTFHGRDIFSPVAARLASGADPTGAGTALDPEELVRLPEPTVSAGDGWMAAEVLTVDRFGNVQLAAGGPTLAGLTDRLTVNQTPAVRGGTFADAPPGGLVVLVDSADRVAISVNGGRASVALGVQPGDVVRVERAPE